MNRPSKQAIAEVSSMSGGRAIKVFYVPTEMDHTVGFLVSFFQE